MTRADKILAIAVTMMISGSVAEYFKIGDLWFILTVLSVLFFFYWLLGDHHNEV